MVAFLEKSTGSAGFHQVIDFLNRSHICYALTKKPDVYISFIKQLWRSVEATTNDNREVHITDTIDGHSMSITEASLRRHLKLDDHDGITSIPNSEIFEQLALMGYHTDSDKLTFKRSAFSSLGESHPYLPTHMNLHIHLHLLCEPSTGNQWLPSTQPSPTQPSPTQPSLTQPSTGAEHHFPTPHDSPLHAVHSHGSDEGSLKLNELTNLVTKLSERIGVLEDDLRKTKKTYSSAFTKLILRVKKLEARVKIGKARKRAKVVLSEDDEDVEDDSSKQGRKLSDAEVQEKASTETEPIIQEVTPTEVIQDQESSEKGSAEVSTAGATKGTASEVPVVSTAEENISTAGRTVTYRRRSEEKRTRKDKGKAIMIESEPKKKSKKEIEQERLSFAEAIRLEEQMNEEQRVQIARDEEIARHHKVSCSKDETKDNCPGKEKYDQILEESGKLQDYEKMKSPKKIEEEDVDTQKEMKEVVKESGAKRKKSLPRKRRTVKRQKLEEDAEKEELKGFLDIIPREYVAKDVESLSTNEMLEEFDRQDVEELYRLVKERYSASRPEGYDLMLWGDLHTLFEHDEEDEI
ncbi:hypothetical protein Tco_0538181 [Tanacetum coccineum]